MQSSFDLLSTSTEETVILVSAHLARITAANDARQDKRHLTRFHARTIPSIDILGYIKRIIKYAPCGSECLLAVLIYLERMADPSERLLTAGFSRKQKLELEETSPKVQNPVVVDSYNVHRLLITGIMVAVKFLSDVFFTNLHMSRVGGLPVHELNQLEVEFLLMNDFNLSVSVEELQHCGDRLLQFIESPESMGSAPAPVPMADKNVDTDGIKSQEPHTATSDASVQPIVPNSVSGISRQQDGNDGRYSENRETDTVAPPAESAADYGTSQRHMPIDVHRNSSWQAANSPTPSSYETYQSYHQVSSPLSCLEPRYVAEPFGGYFPFDVRDSLLRDSLCVPAKRAQSWHSASVFITTDGETLRRRHTQTIAPFHHFHPYSRSSYKHRYQTSPRSYSSCSRQIPLSPAPSRTYSAPLSSSYSSPPSSPPVAPVPVRKSARLMLPDIRMLIEPISYSSPHVPTWHEERAEGWYAEDMDW